MEAARPPEPAAADGSGRAGGWTGQVDENHCSAQAPRNKQGLFSSFPWSRWTRDRCRSAAARVAALAARLCWERSLCATHNVRKTRTLPFIGVTRSDRGTAAAPSAFPLPGERFCGFSVRVRGPMHERLQRGARGSCGAAGVPARGVRWKDFGGWFLSWFRW